ESAPAARPDLPAGAVDADYPDDTAPLETIATGVDIAIGTLLVALLFGFARSMLGFRIAILVAAIAAVHPQLARLSADIMSDTTHLAAYAGACWALWAGISRRSLTLLAIAGAATGLAYLARPEGAALLACGIGGAALVRARVRWKLAACACIALPCALVALPYASHISARGGGILVTGKKLLPEFFWVRSVETPPAAAPAPPPDPAPPPRPPKGFLRHLPPRIADLCWIGFTFHIALPEALLAGLALAIILRGRIRAPSGAVLMCLAAWTIHAALLARLLSFVGDPGYLSRRHVLPMVAVSLPWAVAGIDAAAAWIAARRRAGAIRASALSTILIAVIACAYLPAAIAPLRRDQLAQKQAGLWLRERIRRDGRGDAILFTTREKVAYYARCAYIPLGEAGAGDALGAASASPRYLAFYPGRDEIAPRALERMRQRPERSTCIASFRERNGRVLEIRTWR
ncbi:MAG: glycosyltransferase family 39 protein, partial [Planctomycetes bacterium]|nr:glycosyltransferase family 39 protein [Planctomycetota bacterium]